MSGETSTSRYLRDPRIDGALSKGLAVVVALALSVVGYFFSGLTDELADLRQEIAGLSTAVAVLETMTEQVDALAVRVRETEEALIRLETASREKAQ